MTCILFHFHLHTLDSSTLTTNLQQMIHTELNLYCISIRYIVSKLSAQRFAELNSDSTKLFFFWGGGGGGRGV